MYRYTHTHTHIYEISVSLHIYRITTLIFYAIFIGVLSMWNIKRKRNTSKQIDK